MVHDIINDEVLSSFSRCYSASNVLHVNESVLQQLLPFSALTPLVGMLEGHPACKTLGVCLLVVTLHKRSLRWPK